MKEIDDFILIEKFQAGDINAFRDLVERYRKKIYYLALDLTNNHHDAEDLSQEVFIKAYQSIHQFRMESKFHSWLYRITVNSFISKKRKKIMQIIKLNTADREGWSLLNDPVDEGLSGSPERHAESALIQKHIKTALDKLAPREKAVFVMKHYHDHSLKEIAGMLNISVGTVKSQLFRAAQKIKKALYFYKHDLGLEDAG